MKVGIVGVGYVGLPLAVAFAEAGIDVVGMDVDDERVAQLRAGISPIEDIGDGRLAGLGGAFQPTGDYRALADCEAVLICVPTPLTNSREPDLSHLINAGQRLSEVISKGQLIVLESTTYPGTTRERLAPILEESGLRAGIDFNLAFSPERIDPGNASFTVENTPKVVGGLTDECAGPDPFRWTV